MDLQKIYTDNNFLNAVVPEGQILLFSGTENGKVVTRYKDSDGNFGTISGGTDTSDATATAADIAKGKTAYIATGKVTGTATFTGATEFYKCASVDSTSETWTGYLAVCDESGVYTFEETVTEGLFYGTAFKPIVGRIYNYDATVQITKLWDGIVIPQDGLVFYTSISDPTATTAETGQAITTTAVIAETVDGIPCGYFDSSNSSKIVATLDEGIGTTGTTSLWFRTSETYGPRRLFVLQPGEWNMYLRYSEISFGRGGQEYNPVTYTTDVWHHFLCMSNDGAISIYLDGQSVYTGSLSVNGGVKLQIGGYDGGESIYTGYIAGVRVYNRALNSDEITLLYNEFTPTA